MIFAFLMQQYILKRTLMDINTNYANTNMSLNLGLSSSDSSQKVNANTVQTDLQEQATVVSNAQIPSEFSSTTYASEFGFRVNEQGIFEKDLNKAANLPLSYEINIKSVQSITKELMKQDSTLTPSKIDIPELLNKYYSALKSVESEFMSEDNTYLTRNEILSLNQGFSTNSGEFEDEIMRIYAGNEELNQALKHNQNFNALGLENSVVNFSFDKAINNNASNEFIKPYLSKDGSVSKSGLLMNFAYEDIKNTNQKDSSFFIKPISKPNFSSHQSFYQMVRGEDSFEDFVRQENGQRMSFDLYLYVNGISKQNTSGEKLMLLYHQYMSYQKKMDIKEFTNSSSIYRLYVQALSNEFKDIQNEFSTQNDAQKLNSANETRQNSIDNFFSQRKKQAEFDNIVKSYMSVMA